MPKYLIPIAALLCLFPFVSSGVALFFGVAIALWLGNPYANQTSKLTKKLLAISVVGMGAGMNLGVIGKVGLQGIGYTVIGIIFSLALGYILGKIYKTPEDTSILITVGTAICGGSAIAAVAPVIKAKNHEVSVALGIVFMLNALALFIFPALGHLLSLSQTQFGLWSALAIHDTSSVVGATMQYGPEALQIGTTVKLARALWIIPVASLIGYIYSKKNSTESGQKAKIPWFIPGFIIAAAIVTWIPMLWNSGQIVNLVAKRLLVVTLFLIGLSMTKEVFKNVGIKPFLQGASLWIIVAGTTLVAILTGWIH
ncbi:MAG: putative sulfate exporter family transporter [Bdellovibrionales bacterium]|nr:putative sulfate exporter family transporter [Bdellovibrionales bacterium]